MTRQIKSHSGPAHLSAVVAVMAAAGLTIPQAQARPLPSNGPYGVLCTCGDLDFANSSVDGNIGIEDNGAFVGSGSGTVTGTVQFFGPDNSVGPSRFRPDGISVTGGSAFNVTSVQTDLNNIVMFSQGFRNEAGTSALITAGGLLNASAGILDSAGNRVFTATIAPNFVAGTTFTINGTSSDTVVLNTTTGGLPFNGLIALTGGITSDQVLFNFDAGNYDTGTGGDLLMIENGLASPGPAAASVGPGTAGTYLDPNGPIQIINSLIDGRVFGGDTIDNFGITNSTIVSPTQAPEPTTLALLGAGLLAFAIIRRPWSRPRATLSRSRATLLWAREALGFRANML
jgi:hypothetical protein